MIDMRFVKEILYESADRWGTYSVEYVDVDGNIIIETFHKDGSYSFECKGEE